MSVLRQEGPSYLQRRLTKLYTDTKAHCENVATAARPDDDPELVALQRKFRTQTDRLLAWGLDWSDSKAAQPNDIDESITQAGFSDVVASVMSSIQNILNEADRLRQPEPPPALPPKGGGAEGASSGDLPSKADLYVQPKTHWTEEDIKRSHELLDDLTSCIDTLYELSESRRNMMASESSNSKGRSQTAGPKPSKRSKEPLRSMSYDSKSPMLTKGFVAESPSEVEPPFGFPQHRQQQVEMPQCAYYAPQTSTLPEFSEQEHILPESFAATKHLHIDRSALQLSGASHARSPPPYEQVAQSTNSRVIGRIQTSATPFMTRLTQESTLPILVEFVPMMLEAQNSVTIPPKSRLDKLHRSLDQLVENSRVSHLGLLRFLGYYIDMANARYAFVYQMPIDYFPFLSNPSNLLKELKPKTLVSLFHTGDEQHQDIPVPTLEVRFRLAYNLLLAVLHLRSQNVVHGNINSSNIVVFPGLKDPSRNDGGSLVEDLRHPYLTSLAQFSGNEPTPEPLSASMYRHPDDKRQLDDHSAWAYDLYSLGLVLLEIGLWAPISRLWKMKYNNAMFKQRIENVYINKLGPKCGNTYLQVVQLCLDAPNFLLSTDPMGDLRLRLPCVFTYPRQELVDPDSTFAFSTNFLFTLTKIMARCCAMDIFNPLPAEELDDCLPLAMERDFEAESEDSFTEPQPQQIRRENPVRTGPTDDLATGQERKVRKRTLKKLTTVEIPQEDLNKWNLYIMPRLSKYLQKILRDSSESCSASLMMTGESAEAAKPTICITCTNVKKVRTLLKRYFEMQPGWDLVVLRGEITRSKNPRRRRPKPRCPSPVNSTEPEHHISDLNPHYQQKPLCGASIGAFKNEQHLPPVTYGGAILVDGVPYGMTVHHMLECPSDDEEEEYSEDPPRSSAHWSGGLGGADDDFSYVWEDDGSHFEFEVTDEEDQGQEFSDYWVSDDEFDEDDDFDAEDDAASIGDTAGVEPGDEPPLIVTQPALDDVHEDFFPSLEDRDDEHLASHTLGHVHASSGLRRWRRSGVKHEIDWALIRLDEHRLDPRNVIVNRSEGGHPQIHLDKVARMEELGGLRVHCCGRTSGLQSGRISPAMTLVKLQGRESFSSSFCVDGNFGGTLLFLSLVIAFFFFFLLTFLCTVPGDSGAWVFEKSTGRVCGHVLAWSDRNRVAYIAPMQVLLEDIARTLGACSVTLPGCREEGTINVSSAAVNTFALDAYESSSHEQQRRHGMVASIRRQREEQLPVDIGPPGAIPLRSMPPAYRERPPSWIAQAGRDGATVSMT